MNLITITTYVPKTPFCTPVYWSLELRNWGGNVSKQLAQGASQWNSGVTRESNPGHRARIPSALTTRPLMNGHTRDSSHYDGCRKSTRAVCQNKHMRWRRRTEMRLINTRRFPLIMLSLRGLSISPILHMRLITRRPGDRQTDRQRDRETDRQTDRQTANDNSSTGHCHIASYVTPSHWLTSSQGHVINYWTAPDR